MGRARRSGRGRAGPARTGDAATSDAASDAGTGLTGGARSAPAGRRRPGRAEPRGGPAARYPRRYLAALRAAAAVLAARARPNRPGCFARRVARCWRRWRPSCPSGRRSSPHARRPGGGRGGDPAAGRRSGRGRHGASEQAVPRPSPAGCCSLSATLAGLARAATGRCPQHPAEQRGEHRGDLPRARGVPLAGSAGRRPGPAGRRAVGEHSGRTPAVRTARAARRSGKRARTSAARTRLTRTPSGCRSGLVCVPFELDRLERPLHARHGEHRRVGHQHGPMRGGQRAAGELAERRRAVDDHELVGLDSPSSAGSSRSPVQG